MGRWTMAGAILIATLALVGTGCGGSEDVTDEAVVTESASTEPLDQDGETGTTDESESETETESGETETGATPNVDDLPEECKQLVSLARDFGKAFGAAGATGGENLADASEAFENFADRVPEEIRDDFRVLAKAFTEYADALKDLDLGAGATPSPDTIAKLQQIVQRIDQTKVQAASDRIAAWSTENCTP